MKTENIETETAEPVSSMSWFCVSWQVAEAAVVWLAVTGVTGAGNIVKLIAVVNVLLAPLGLVAAAADKKRDKRPNWMKHFSTVADFGETFALCWWGWWWCSLGFALGSLVGAAIRYRSGETQNDEALRPAVEGGSDGAKREPQVRSSALGGRTGAALTPRGGAGGEREEKPL